MSGCHSAAIKYPEGGYAYLENITGRDSDYYFLPVRKLVPRADSMVYAREKYFFKSFNEPNLSIRPAGEDMFRLSIEGFGIFPVIITLTNKGFVVKQQKKDNIGSLYPQENVSQLSEDEELHYFFIKKFFPIGKRTYVRGRQLYIDSMIKMYPKLSDATYYQYLIDKVIDKDAAPFQYTQKTISLTGNQYKNLVAQINNSGYWGLPFSNPSAESISDGYGFTLEANTKYKYMIVSCNTMPNAADTRKLKQACQRILDYAKTDAGITIWDNNSNK